MSRRAWLAGAIPLIALLVIFTMAVPSEPDEAHPLIQALVPTAILGIPLAAAAMTVARRFELAATGADWPARLLSVATTGLDGAGEEWGRAMRSELASIEGPQERRSFAIGCTLTSIRRSVDRRAWSAAGLAAIILTFGVLVFSRVSFAAGQTGTMSFTLLAPVVVLSVTGFVAGSRRSFRHGLLTGALALVLSLIGVLAVQVVEAGYWYDNAGIFIVDGDAPLQPIERITALLDPLTPSFILLFLAWWAPWPVLGAALATRRRVEAGAMAHTTVI